MDTIEIPLSKSKIVLMLFGCAIFVAGGIAFIISPETFHSFIVSSDVIIMIVGGASVALFGYFGVTLFEKAFDKSPGLIISIEGVTDNSSGVSVGFVPWSDIIRVGETVVASQRFINLIVRNPQEYINRQKSAFKRKIAEKNYSMFGTAVGISTNALKIKYADLKKILEERVAKFGAS
jgi:hypothetical protein